MHRKGQKSELEIVTYGDISPHMANILASSLADQCAETIDAIKRPISQEAYDALKPKSPSDITREALRVLAPSLGVSPPQPKAKLVFYRFNKTRDAVMNDGDACLQGSMKVRDALLSNFNVGGFKTMFVHYGNSSGWRCKFTAEECDILFLDGPAPAEMQQARGRLTRG